MKQVEITSKIIGRGGSTTSASPSLDLSGYALISDLLNYVTISGNEDVTGLHNFVNGLKVGGIELIQKNGNAFLKGNLVVEGGITMYGDGEGGSSVPSYSTLGSLLNVDESNDSVASVDRVLFQSAGSNVWSWKPLSEIGGGSSGGSVSGDYLPLANAIYHTRTQNPDPNTKYDNWMGMSNKNTPDGANYYHILSSTWDNMYWSSQLAIPTAQSSNMYYRRGASTSSYNSWVKLLDANNYSSYALPLSGGTINGAGDYLYVPLFVNALNSQISGITFQTNGTERGHVGYHYELGMRLHTASTAGIAVSNSDVPIFYTSDGSVKNTILHSGNISSYNAGSATKLQTARTIWGQSFDGTANVSGILTLNYNSSTAGIELTREGSNESSIAFNNGYGRSVIGSWGGGTHLWIQGVGNILTADMITGNVGIGTTSPSPSEKLQVEGNCWLKNGRLYALYASFDDISSMTDRVNYTAARIGTFDRTEGGFVIQLGKHDVSNAGWRQQFSIINSGWTETLFSVDRSGNVIANGGITMYSDQRKKTILNHVELSLKQIADAPLIQHYYNSDQNKTTHVGSIAQYWAGLNDWFCKLDNEGFYTMEIQNCALASAISIARHLEKYESKTDKKIRQLKKRISQLEDELELLKKGV